MMNLKRTTMSDRDDEFMGDEQEDKFTGFGLEDEEDPTEDPQELEEEDELDANGMHIEEEPESDM